LHKGIHHHANIGGDFPEQSRGNVSAFMKRNRGAATISMPELLVRTSLSHLDETERLENRNDFMWFEDGHCHGLCHLHGLNSHELGLKRRLAIFEQHCNHFL
jgi:hypothetical protein